MEPYGAKRHGSASRLQESRAIEGSLSSAHRRVVAIPAAAGRRMSTVRFMLSSGTSARRGCLLAVQRDNGICGDPF